MDKHNNKKKVKRMAVSLKPAPVFEGEAAKRLIKMLDNPPNNSELFKKLEAVPQVIKKEKE